MKKLTLSVLQFNTFIKNILDAEEFLSGIGIFGEVTNFKISAGNAYFDLKDGNAMLSCVKFGADDLFLKNGDLITVFGKVNFYVKSGRLNFVVANIQFSGQGELYQKFLLLKEKLEKEGLFSEEAKKSIPKYAMKIGVVTSETGAVIRDIINVTRKKNPYTDIIVYPAKVQGVGAEFEICEGIEYFNLRDDIDTIIVARGGGSFEDLSPFNTEQVARAIFASKKPIISAVGHETDFSLCDFASDLRVPTPSVGAEVAVFNYYDLITYINMICDDNFNLISEKIKNNKNYLKLLNDAMKDKIKLKSNAFIADITSKVNDIYACLKTGNLNRFNSVNTLSSVISKLNPLEVLKSGYAIVECENKRVSSLNDLKLGDEISIQFTDGQAKAKIIKK